MTRVTCGLGVSLTPQAIIESPLYRGWAATFKPGWSLDAVEVQAVRCWPIDSANVYMLFVVATATDPQGRTQAVSLMLRGHTIDILAIVTDGTTDHVVLVEQPRVAAGKYVLSNPAGTIEPGELSVQSAALRELAEEVTDSTHPDDDAIEIEWSQPEWLGPAVVGTTDSLLVTPGGSDEDSAFCVVRATLTPNQIKRLRGRTAGLVEEGEHIKLHVVKLSEALTYLGSHSRPDLKTVTSILLYLYWLES